MTVRLETERLELTQAQMGEYAENYAMVSAADTRRFLGPTEPSLADSFARFLRNAGSWAVYGYGNFTVRLKGRGAMIGTCGIFRTYRGFGKGLDDTAEAGWILHHEHRGQGYAREALEAVFEWYDAHHGAETVRCMIEAGNIPSERLAKRLGFERYDEEIPEDGGATLILYERAPGAVE